MKAGLLSDWPIFQIRTVTPINIESSEISWGNDFSLPTEISRQSETTARFTIRYFPEMTPASHRIIWDNAIWNITSATHDRRRTMLILDCDFSMMVEATDLASTERQFVDGLPLIRPGP